MFFMLSYGLQKEYLLPCDYFYSARFFMLGFPVANTMKIFSYFCTSYDLDGPVRNVFDACRM
jgi:hypothetical protein